MHLYKNTLSLFALKYIETTHNWWCSDIPPSKQSQLFSVVPQCGRSMHAHAYTHTHTHTHTHIHSFHRKSSGSPKWEVKTLLWWILHDVSKGWFRQQFQKNSPRLWFLLPLVPAANRQNITHTHTHTHRWETYQLLLPLVPAANRQNITHTHTHTHRWETYQLPLMPLSSLPTAPLQPIIIDDLFNPEEGDRSKGLSFDLLSLNVKWLWLLLHCLCAHSNWHIHTR